MSDDRSDGEGPAIGRIEIIEGTVVHTNLGSGRTIEAQGVDVAAWMASASRPKASNRNCSFFKRLRNRT